MDGLDQSRVRGAALHFIRAAFVDARRSVDVVYAADLGAGSVYRADANVRRVVGIPAAETLGERKSRHSGCGVLCDESKRAADDLYPQRFRGATGMRHVSAGSAGDAAAGQLFGGLGLAAFQHGLFCDSLCGGVAFERARGGAGELFDRAADGLGRDYATIVEDSGARRLRAGGGIESDRLLPDTRGV